LKLDIAIAGTPTAGADARAAEQSGYAGAWAAEMGHDPFLTCALAADRTRHVTIGTSIAVAFARNPMSTAYMANDLQALSRGRFVLGLGTQVRPHIEKRFSMPWDQPVARMREYVAALRSIWDCWQEAAPLAFRGDYYTHTLMSPFFTPERHDFGSPHVFLAGVGPKMARLAGQVGDGFICHAFTTPRYLREVTLPELRAGRAEAGLEMKGFDVTLPAMVVTGHGEEDVARATAAVRAQLAFYASTPSYRGVLDLHGWGALQEELTALSKQGHWGQMPMLIDDDMLTTLAVVAPPHEVGPELQRRLGGVVTRITLYMPYDIDRESVDDTVAGVRSACGDL
jgi:probable F420-dependent oxidoreductase